VKKPETSLRNCRVLRCLRFAGLIVAVIFAQAPVAQAWGVEGHAVIADIAEAHLTPQSRAAVHELLATENYTHLAEVASWADYVRLQRRYTAPWHFVNIPLDVPSYDPARDSRMTTALSPASASLQQY
jgi:hypothetical protein